MQKPWKTESRGRKWSGGGGVYIFFFFILLFDLLAMIIIIIVIKNIIHMVYLLSHSLCM